MSNWFMFDNHTFQRLSDNPHEAVEQAMECFDRDGCGSVFCKEEQHSIFELDG